MARPEPVRIAIVGAESTGKTQLAQALSARLRAQDVACVWVPEVLREWCDRHGRTPAREEQRFVAELQRQAIAGAGPADALVLCDTTPLMTAVYSLLLFGDDSLLPAAIEWQRCCDFTLLTALDLPWVADGLQRDGPQVRRPVDDLLRTLLLAHRLPFSVVQGSGERRTDQALAALSRRVDALAAGPVGTGAVHMPPQDPASPAPSGMLTGLLENPSMQRSWQCPDCDQPECEHQSLRDRRAADGAATLRTPRPVTAPGGSKAGAPSQP